LSHEPQDVQQRPAALAIPEHETDGRFLRHLPVLGGVVLEIALPMLGTDRTDRPSADARRRGGPAASLDLVPLDRAAFAARAAPDP
jgi:hypothetical protein